jgi:hypothetical protein
MRFFTTVFLTEVWNPTGAFNLVNIINCYYMLWCLHSEIGGTTRWTWAWGPTVYLPHVLILLLKREGGLQIWGGNCIHNERIAEKVLRLWEWNSLQASKWINRNKNKNATSQNNMQCNLDFTNLEFMFSADLHTSCMILAKCL